MKLYKTILLFGLIILLKSCTNDNEISVQFESVDGISEDSKVLFKGYEVGKVKSIKINESGFFIVNIKLDDYSIPDSTTFIAFSPSMLGPKAIDIRMSGSLNDYKGIHQDNNVVDSISNKTFKLLESTLINTKNQDSLLIEIRRLNENLEKLNN